MLWIQMIAPQSKWLATIQEYDENTQAQQGRKITAAELGKLVLYKAKALG